MKNKSKKGISLIVLVITIIVMIILAGAIIVTLSNTGIMNKAQQAVDKTDMKQIETLASTLWADAYLDGARTKEDLEKAVKDGLAANKITEQDYDGYKLQVTTSGVGFKDVTHLNPKETIPEGGVYYVGVTAKTAGDYTGATATYNAGDKFPSTVTAGDVYVFGDYEYKYNNAYTGGAPYQWAQSETQNGWGVRVLDTTKTSYGEVLQTINNKEITAMTYTYGGCTALTTSPVFPDAVTTVAWCFYECTALTTVPVLPDKILDMTEAFSFCTALAEIPNIPRSVTSLSGTFYECTSLVKSPDIPASVMYMDSMLDGCTSLTGTITVNANPIEYVSCFGLSSAGKDITLAGTCSAETKQNLANTSNSSYRKVYDESGTLLK